MVWLPAASKMRFKLFIKKLEYFTYPNMPISAAVPKIRIFLQSEACFKRAEEIHTQINVNFAFFYA